MPLILHNPGTTTIELQQAGITIAPGQNYDVTRRIGGLLASSTELASRLSNQTLRVRRQPTGIFLPAAEAQRAVRMEEAQNNLDASTPPSVTDDETTGYAFGSLWRVGLRVWQCVSAAAGDADWEEIAPIKTAGLALNRYYGGLYQGETNGTGQTLAADTMYPSAFHFPRGFNFNRIGFDAASSGGQNSAVRLAIYSNLDGLPATLISNLGVVSIASSGAKELIINYVTNGDVFWVVMHTSASFQVRPIRNGFLDNHIIGSITPTFGPNQTLLAARPYANGVPTTFPAISTNTIAPPYIWFRRV